MQRAHGGRAGRVPWQFLVATTVVLASLSAPGAAQVAAAERSAAALPDRLSDVEFWSLVSAISEPGGYFRLADNFTSNEGEIGVLFTRLRERGVRGGVYMGVGPEQNFTYIAAIRPAMAFIVDIRRQAVMQHLMYKAIFELSETRSDFISLLFSKPRPPGLDTASTIQQIWEAYWPVASDSAMWKSNYARIVEHLTRTHGFTFTPDESGQMEWVYQAFFQWGPSISTRGAPGGYRGGGNGTTFADLTGYALDDGGQARSFLSTEEHYRTVKALHERNLIVPVSGDFGGPKAIRAIGAWLADHGGTVSAFYVSNVEQYLVQDGKVQAFYDNVATLPVHEASLFIRSRTLGRIGLSQQLCAIAPYIAAVRAEGFGVRPDAATCVR